MRTPNSRNANLSSKSKQQRHHTMSNIEPQQAAELAAAAKPLAAKVGIGSGISLLGLGIDVWVSVLSAIYVLLQIGVFVIKNKDLIRGVLRKGEKRE